ncbi:hypothetical protein J8273_5714 [Carpediemonas membranifera]|uniref:Uncharacterized protein n=1 Tax=Carpediemonas membranifera TaxID=201153 RepID=A0A8J6E3A8_9EUKA|nr:hypothetical protein J8273_5714 [Carpediemonas membranifera]|eukprot:KAG9392902.1 hypothetical protein J8273_5714 [Carpediemonas membranifera]
MDIAHGSANEDVGPSNLVEWAIWEEQRLMRDVFNMKGSDISDVPPSSSGEENSALEEAANEGSDSSPSCSGENSPPEMTEASIPTMEAKEPVAPAPEEDNDASYCHSGCPSPVEITIGMNAVFTSIDEPTTPVKPSEPTDEPADSPRPDAIGTVEAEVQADETTSPLKLGSGAPAIDPSDIQKRLEQARLSGCCPPSQSQIDRVSASIAMLKSTLAAVTGDDTDELIDSMKADSMKMVEDLSATHRRMQDTLHEYDLNTVPSPAAHNPRGSPESEKAVFSPNRMREDLLPDTPTPHCPEAEQYSPDMPESTFDNPGNDAPVTPTLVGDEDPLSLSDAEDEHTNRELGGGPARPNRITSEYLHRSRAMLASAGQGSVDPLPVLRAGDEMRREYARLTRSPVPGSGRSRPQM